ncbi:MAG: hypothetical protein ACOX5G_01490 [Kiritimatiellia bacterium]|jgi:hypothetical protein
MKRPLLLAALSATLVSAAFAGENMIGRQSQNEGIAAVPAPGAVAIDGDLSDWDWSGRICVFADTNVRNAYSVEAAAMWDKDYYYLAAKWNDPTPMFNTVDPDFAPNEGWKSDSWQIRIRSDQIGHFTTWFFEPEQMPVMHISYVARGHGGDFDVLRGVPGSADLLGPDGQPSGVQMAYRRAEGPESGPGAGFIQEIRIPWSRIFRTVPEIRDGLVFRQGNEFLWGDVTGRAWPVHRYADNMQPGVTSREFYWTSHDSWGDARLAAAGNLEPREYKGDTATLEGTVPISVAVPANAARFTLVIETPDGRRVRNLAGDCLPMDYATGAEAGDGTRNLEVPWDCLDDAGRLVDPGTYRARGLTHTGLSAEYDASFYNPGTPPWDTVDNTGAWGADHNQPCSVAAAGATGWMIVGWSEAEGGHAIVAVGPDGRKRWGVIAGAPLLAANSTHVFSSNGEWLHRYALETGAFAPFTADGTARPFELAMETLFDEAPGAPACALAADETRLAVAFTNGLVALLDTATAAVAATQTLPLPAKDLALADGVLYALAGERNVVALDLASGARTEMAPKEPGLRASALAVDAEGNVLLADVGDDQRVKAYNAKGRMAYACGRRGGRPRSGKFVPEAMANMSSVAVGTDGLVWVVERSNDPRRVSVWNRKGQLERDYIGNTGYAARDTYADPWDPDLVYCGPLRIRLDREAGSWALEEILWSPDPAKRELFPLWSDAHWYARPNFLESGASGKNRRYLHFIGRYGAYHAIYFPRNRRWQPVAAFTSVEYLNEQLPDLDFGGRDPSVGVIWNDFDRDGALSIDECEFLPAGRLRNGGWGAAPGEDLTLYINDLHEQTIRCRPESFASDGAPIYSGAAMERFPANLYGENRPAGDRIISFGGDVVRGGVVMANDLRTGECLWTYPNRYPQVHGSHRAPMPSPGLLIGTLKFCGLVDFGGEAGTIFQMRGNLGQDYFMTTDGLFVGALFEDGRLPSTALPATEAELRGMDLSGFSNGGEPFNGSFVRQSDGQTRMTIGLARQAGMLLTLDGFDSIRRFDGPTLQIDAATIVKADAENAARARKAAEPKVWTVARFAHAPSIDGVGQEWGDVPSVPIRGAGSPEWMNARLACDDAMLYAFLEVRDQSPWMNAGTEFQRLFKTGDAIDIQLGLGGDDPTLRANDFRVVVAPMEGKTVAVLMKPADAAAPAGLRHTYSSPVFDKPFDRVELCEAVLAAQHGTRPDTYGVEIAIPWSLLGIEARSGTSLRGDVGFIASDTTGRTNTARTYWANPFTNLVNDEPSEAQLFPQEWGVLVLE